jgi:pSer/pThr/pTyr-binding forkhead associated (FHA) protein
MPARVMLIATAGPLTGQRFTFDGPTVCTVGRSPDCLLHLPSDPDDLTTSRHHCELVIEPPAVSVRDLNSRNGTYVNGESIGRRPPGAEPEMPVDLTAQPLHNGDTLRVGRNVFRVTVRRRIGSRSTHTRRKRLAMSSCSQASDQENRDE